MKDLFRRVWAWLFGSVQSANERVRVEGGMVLLGEADLGQQGWIPHDAVECLNGLHPIVSRHIPLSTEARLGYVEVKVIALHGGLGIKVLSTGTKCPLSAF